ncbi:MAG: HEAT repeat domain-containing protein [Rubripirellula sp.]
MSRSIWIAISSVLCFTGSALSDTVELSGGGHLTGQVNRNGDTVIVRVDDEIQVALPGSRVRRVVDSDDLQAYLERSLLVGDDAEGHYQMAIWCVTGGNVPGDTQRYKRYHLERAIELNPDHAKARASLGFKKQDGKWVRTSDLMQGRGMITRAGRWELPEAVAIEDMQDSTNVDAKRWLKEVKRLVAAVQRNSSKAPEALDALKAIEDPLAATAIAEQLRDSRGKQSRAVRMMWVKLLGRFKNSVSVEALVKAGLVEDDDTIREAALDELVQYGAGSAVATYLPYLKKNDNRLVNRAARGLSWFPDPELALTYVDALVTKHTTEQAPGASINAGFGDNGGGMQMGGKKKVYTEHIKNPSVLSLVKVIEPEADYGYNEQAWREYFASKRTSFSGDLRRDF